MRKCLCPETGAEESACFRSVPGLRSLRMRFLILMGVTGFRVVIERYPAIDTWARLERAF